METRLPSLVQGAVRFSKLQKILDNSTHSLDLVLAHKTKSTDNNARVPVTHAVYLDTSTSCLNMLTWEPINSTK